MDKKYCSKCKTEKSISEFQVKYKETGVLQSWCTQCLNAQKKKHYRANKKKYFLRNKKRISEIWDFVNQFKEKCEKCGYDKCKKALDFHHKDPSKKEIEIGKSAVNGWCKARIEKEIKKCIVLCKNCHAEIHASVV